MEFDAEVKATYASTSKNNAHLYLAKSLTELLPQLHSTPHQARLDALEFKTEYVSDYSWNPASGELVFQFIHSNIHDICQVLLAVLHQSGFINGEALIYSDECECIMDDDGVVHRLGERMYFDADNRLVIDDYPEVEYEYI